MKKQEKALEKIEEYIIKHNLPPHDRLPSERQMEVLFDCKRTTLRTALRYLTLTGVIYSKKGSGHYIAPPKLCKNLQDTKGTYEFAKESGKKLTSRIIDFKKEKSDKETAKKMKIKEGDPVWKLERVRYMDGIPVTCSVARLRGDLFKGLKTFDFSTLSLYETLKKHYGTKIESGEESLKITYSDEYESDLLEIELNTPLIYQSGLTRDSENRVFEVFKELTRSEYILFTSELKRINRTEE